MIKALIEFAKLIPFIFKVYNDVKEQFKKAADDKKAEKHEKLAIGLERAKKAKTSEERKDAINSIYDSLN